MLQLHFLIASCVYSVFSRTNLKRTRWPLCHLIPLRCHWEVMLSKNAPTPTLHHILTCMHTHPFMLTFNFTHYHLFCNVHRSSKISRLYNTGFRTSLWHKSSYFAKSVCSVCSPCIRARGADTIALFGDAYVWRVELHLPPGYPLLGCNHVVPTVRVTGKELYLRW